MSFLVSLGHVFLLLCRRGVFDRIANVNFILLGAGYFCVSINIFKLCSGIWWSYLKRVSSFPIFFQVSLDWIGASFSLEVIPLCVLSTCEYHKSWGRAVWLSEREICPPSLTYVSPGNPPRYPSGPVFPQPWVVRVLFCFVSPQAGMVNLLLYTR